MSADALDEHGLARAGFAGEDGEAGLEREVERLDHRELSNADEPDHGRNDAARRAGPTLRSKGQNCHDIIELTLIFRAW
jgi:hypothetical protein